MELLNYGYEYNSQLINNGFLAAANLVHLKIDSVTFSYNMLFSSYSPGIIFLTNFYEFYIIN